MFRERQILQEHMCKQYSGTVILYVMFLFSEDFSCPRRNSKQTLDSFSVTALETLAMLDSVLLLTQTSGYLNVSMRNGILVSLYSPYTFKTDNTFVIKHLNYSRDLLQCFVRLRATYYKACRMSFRKVLS